MAEICFAATKGGARRRRGEVLKADCPSRGVLDHVTSRWGSLAMVMLRERTMRFSELVRGVGGASEKMMAQSLRALEEDGLVVRRVYPTKPPKVEYSLSAMGREAADRVAELTGWVEANVGAVLRFRERRLKEVTAREGGRVAVKG